MYKTINQSNFMDAFNDMGRKDEFTYEGKIALFNYLEEYEESIGEKIELDVIALCCEYNEYDDLADALAETGYKDRQDLEDNTSVIDVEGGSIIIANV